jgi:hypothetical protein
MEHSIAIVEFAELVANRTIVTSRALLDELAREPDALLYGRRVADLTEQLLKTALAMQNLYFIGCGKEEGDELYVELDGLYGRMLAVLDRVVAAFHQMARGEVA